MKKTLIVIGISILSILCLFIMTVIIAFAYDILRARSYHHIWNKEDAEAYNYLKEGRKVSSIEIYKYPVGIMECAYWEELQKYLKIILPDKERDEFASTWVKPSSKATTPRTDISKWSTFQNGGILFTFQDGERLFYNFIIGNESVTFSRFGEQPKKARFFAPMENDCYYFHDTLMKPLLEKHIQMIK